MVLIRKVPILVIGLTARIDVIEILEKRVQSRQVLFITLTLPNETLGVYKQSTTPT